MPYRISLEDSPSSITEQAKQNAESRFQRTLERNLGEPETVLLAYQAWQNAAETDESELSTETIALAKKWISAATKAQTEGYRDLGESEAYFDILINK